MVKIDDCVTQSKSQLFNQKQTSGNMILVGAKYAFVPWHSSLFRIVLLPDAAEDMWLALCLLQNTKNVSPAPLQLTSSQLQLLQIHTPKIPRVHMYSFRAPFSALSWPAASHIADILPSPQGITRGRESSLTSEK